MTLSTTGIDNAVSALGTALETRLNNLKTGISESGVFNISISGAAGTAAKLSTAVRINGALFDGSASINVPSLFDVNGNPLIWGYSVNNATNYAGITNATSGNPVIVGSSGSDNDIGLSLITKGQGTLTLGGGLWVDVRPLTGKMRLFAPGNVGSWTFDLGATTTNQSLYFPLNGNVTLKSGTMATLENANEFANTITLDKPLMVANTFNIGSTAPGSQQNGLYVTEFSTSVGTVENPINTVAIAAQTQAFRSIALTVDTFGYLWGFNANPNSGIAAFVSQTKAADQLTQARQIGLSGDATGTIDFDGTANVTIPVVLGTSGVTAGTYNNITVDAKGRAVGGANIAYLTDNQPITVTGDVTGSGTTALNLTLIPTGITPGTYNSLTVDANGRVTAGQSIDYSAGGAGTIPLTVTGDVTGSGTGTIDLELNATGVTAGNYTKVSVNAKGLVLSGTTLTPTDIPNLDYSKIVSGTPTTVTGYGITDAVRTTDNLLPLDNGNIASWQITTPDVSPSQIVDTFATSLYRSAEYMIQAAQGTSYQILKMLVVQDGFNVFIDEYGGTNTNGALISVDASLVANSVMILVTPTVAGVTIKAIRTAIFA